MTCYVGGALDIIFYLQIVHQPVINGVRRFGRSSKFGELVTWQGTPVFVIEKFGCLAIDILLVMDRTSRED